MAALTGLTALAGCASEPAYRPPAIAAPAAYKESPSADATWFPAAPADALERGPWWELFGDPTLNALVAQVEISNQTVAGYVAAYAQAQALVREARASLFPSLTLNYGATRSRSGGSGSNSNINGSTGQTNFGGTRGNQQLDLGASWEPDLWGKLRDSEAGAIASVQQSEANLAGARLSAQATLATDYFALREADNEIALLGAAVAAYERALKITQNQYRAAIAQRTDVLQAQTQLETTRANLSSLVSQRAQLEHAIALLIGKAPAELSIPAGVWIATVPAVPLSLPSELLQRRPDIAAAERAVAVANTQIGIARSAYFPSLALSASYGTDGASLPALFRASNLVWSIGASAAQTLFDAGATAARIDSARAARDQAVATYRQTVLSAFGAVEDQLATSRSLAEQEGQRRDAATDAARAEQLTLNQYLQGQVAYTSVVTAQVTALNARQTLSQLQSNRQAAAISLIQALGGGWQAPTAPGAAGTEKTAWTPPAQNSVSTSQASR